jgi:hypothetical protein
VFHSRLQLQGYASEPDPRAVSHSHVYLHQVHARHRPASAVEFRHRPGAGRESLAAISLAPPPLSRRERRENTIRMDELNNGYFPITNVHRTDLEGLGYDVSKVDDGTMVHLASKMADAYLEHVYWIDLPIIADHLGIPRRGAE